MKERGQYDITSASFEAFVTFLFDHKVIPSPTVPEQEAEPWYWHSDVIFDPVRVTDYYIRLFTNPTEPLARFDDETLEQAFWAIQDCNLDCAVSTVIWDDEVPFQSRADCVRSMYHLFDRLFFSKALETSVQMWWDSLAYAWHCGNRSRDKGGEDQLMQDVMFETLERILFLESEVCQGAALHGLGHLHHPKTEETIRRFLTARPAIRKELREYALAAARFEVM